MGFSFSEIIMILGVFLRNYKCYKGINYIPLSDGETFCGLLGNNGVGKSSILEALNCVLNDAEWNPNVSYHSSNPDNVAYIVPIFLIKKNPNLKDYEKQEFNNNLENIEELNNIIMDNLDNNLDIAPRNIKHLKSFSKHINLLKENLNLDDYYLLPIGIDYFGKTSFSIFNNLHKIFKKHNDNNFEAYNGILRFIKNYFEYVYIPREINADTFTKLETKEIQSLMGETLYERLDKIVDEKTIKNININLVEFIRNLSKDLDDYSYKAPKQRQPRLKKLDIHNLIIKAFFEIRKLHKKFSDDIYLDINTLSSGEKQKAIIDLAYSLLKSHNTRSDNLIIALDEPESSLHMSSCYDLFNKLNETSKLCRQVLFTTHWYGFLPIVQNGNTTVLTKDLKRDEVHNDFINLYRYREQVNQEITQSSNSFPSSIRLKSTNDLVQSIVTSLLGDNPFNWIICEGTTEKIYLSYYLSEQIKLNNLRIIPVGGASKVRHLYNHLSTTYEDFKTEIKGKVFLLSDTDSELVQYETTPLKNLRCERMVAKDEKISLVRIKSNPVSPETCIEDSLNPEVYIKTLQFFLNEDVASFLYDSKIINQTATISKYSLDLRSSETDILKAFFNAQTNNKFLFAKKYIEISEALNHPTPEWIEEIKNWLIY